MNVGKILIEQFGKDAEIISWQANLIDLLVSNRNKVRLKISEFVEDHGIEKEIEKFEEEEYMVVVVDGKRFELDFEKESFIAIKERFDINNLSIGELIDMTSECYDEAPKTFRAIVTIYGNDFVDLQVYNILNKPISEKEIIKLWTTCPWSSMTDGETYKGSYEGSPIIVNATVFDLAELQ